MRRLLTTLFAVIAMVLLTVTNSLNASAQGNLTPDVARDSARETWHFGLSLVMFEKQN
jgi:hypothetical protein